MGQFCILRRNNISKTVEVFLVIVKLVLFSRWRCLESYYHAVFIYEPKTIIPSQQTNPIMYENTKFLLKMRIHSKTTGY